MAPLDRSGDEVVFPLDHLQGLSPHCSTLARAVRVIRGGVSPRGGPCSGGAVGRPQGRIGSPASSPRPWRGRGVRVRTPEHALLLPARRSMLPPPTCSAALCPRGRGSSGPMLMLSVCPELSEPDPGHPDCSDFREAAWLTPSQEPPPCWNVTVRGRAHPRPGCLPAPASRLLGAGLWLRGFARAVGSGGRAVQTARGRSGSGPVPAWVAARPSPSLSVLSANESHSLRLQGGRRGERLAQSRGQCSFFLLFSVMKNCLVKGLSWRSSWLGLHLSVWGAGVGGCVCGFDPWLGI